MKIIIAGAGEVGTHLAKMLTLENHDITVIDIEPDQIKNIELFIDIRTIEASAISLSGLIEAGVAGADLFIAVTHFQEMNISSAILAKKLGAKKTIARIIDSEYIKIHNVQMFKELGIDSLIYPQYIAAQEIANFIRQASTKEIYDFCDSRFSLFVIKIDINASIIGKTLEEISNQEPKLEFRAVAIVRDKLTFIPKKTDIFKLGDVVYVLSTNRGTDTVLKYTGIKRVEINNILIVGGSRTGRAVALELQNHFNVKIIEQNHKKAERLASKLSKKTIIIEGDGRNFDLLMEVGIRKMDTVIAVTGNSEMNILTCLHAKRFGVKRTIAEVENLDYISLANTLGIDIVVNKKFVAANHINKYTMKAEVQSVKVLTNTDSEVLEFLVVLGSKIIGKQLKDIDFPDEALIGGIVRDKEAFIAQGNTIIKAGDRVLVFSRPSVVADIEKFFK